MKIFCGGELWYVPGLVLGTYKGLTKYLIGDRVPCTEGMGSAVPTVS